MFINEVRLNKRWWIAPIIFYGFIFFLLLNKLTLPKEIGILMYTLGGIVVLLCEFGWNNVKKMFKAPAWNIVYKVPLAIISCLIISSLTMLLGKLFQVQDYKSNLGLSNLDDQNSTNIIKIFLTSWIQLIGEELITAIICLPILIILKRFLPWKLSLCLAILISSLIFGLLHIETYQYHFYQALIVIGMIRIPFTYLWFNTNTLWGGIIAHICFDYLLIVSIIMT
ncbi:CPBP family intramembrane glutamic endopeptidase [Macrococcus sp. DPC7161]|uniref:CPBP family intramembrane glutamic endopeptidase n=1 Tax=Macrococcus sp. DPC7161 TaxID=2507060 RepID=UPI00100AB40D|nr:CPBP family intramembrane glutamic endopeptidase [Macrococcus sp. DPC7161]RXK17180.1 CPBP family intramembrane metalloprotease [Macrococcus sp. DPC7161]